jgi:hypothetical protein
MSKTPVRKPKRKAQAPAPVSRGASVSVLPEDEDLARVASEKIASGDKVSRAERQAFRRVNKAREEELRGRFYETVSKRDYVALSGRQVKVLNEQAERYNIPLQGPVVNLYRVLSRMHSILAENRHVLKVTGSVSGGDPLLDGGAAAITSPNLEKYRGEKAALARLERLEREGVLIKRDRVREALTRLAYILRSAMDTLQRSCGEPGREILEEALVEFERQMGTLFGEGDDLYADSSE